MKPEISRVSTLNTIKENMNFVTIKSNNWNESNVCLYLKFGQVSPMRVKSSKEIEQHFNKINSSTCGPRILPTAESLRRTQSKVIFFKFRNLFVNPINVCESSENDCYKIPIKVKILVFQYRITSWYTTSHPLYRELSCLRGFWVSLILIPYALSKSLNSMLKLISLFLSEKKIIRKAICPLK